MKDTETKRPARASCGRVLLIDDSEILLEIVQESLQKAGWETRAAATGDAGLAIAREWDADVVVCDLHMPDMGGLDVLREMRAIDALLPFVVLSGDDDLSAVLNAVHAGAFDYVIKAGDDIRPLLAAIDRAALHCRLARENTRLTDALRETNAELEERLEELDEKHQLLIIEQRRSEQLLLNILPEPIARRLKEEERTIADGFGDVTVLFADIANFTELSAGKAPRKLVELLNEIFSRFDRLTEQHGLEKIKTIGDAYMAAAGLPRVREDHASAVAEMALDMLEEVALLRQDTGEAIEVRVGLNSGPVVAGVIGEKKFIYDLWGTTVNVASRMESMGVPGKIQVTETVYERLRDAYEFEHRGDMHVKGWGDMETYFLRGRKGRDDRE